MRDGVEVAFEIGVHHIMMAFSQQLLYPSQGVTATSAWPKTVTLGGELLLEDRFDYLADRPLHDAVRDRRYPKRPLLAVCFGDVRPPDRLGLVMTQLQLLRQMSQVRFRFALVLLDGDPVHARRTLVPSGFTPRGPEVFGVVDLINQTEPHLSFHSVFQSCQHAIRPDRCFRPRPAGANSSGLFSLLRHCRRLMLHKSFLHASTFLRPLAPCPLRHFAATMDALTPARRFFVPDVADNERLRCREQVSLIHV